MKHHFGDYLDRAGDYWKMTPNKDRYQLMLDNFPVLDSSIESITISKKHTNWREILGLKNLEELTCLLYTSPSPRDRQKSRMPSSA